MHNRIDWTCPHCGQHNAAADGVCGLCGEIPPVPEAPNPSEQWQAPYRPKVPPLEQPDTTLGFVPDSWFIRRFPLSLLFLRFHRWGQGAPPWGPTARVAIPLLLLLALARLSVALYVRYLLARHALITLPR